jgi:uncharacterized protein YbjQ (UPF0145 family)
MEQIIIFLVLLGVGYFVGNYFETKHYEDIQQREKRTLHVPMMSWGAKQELPYAHDTQLFVGSVVVANDYFKTVAASLRNLVGGQVTVYEKLLDRARREALLRMKEEAMLWGATQIVNVRFETANIGGQSQNNKGLAAVEVMAYGTGIR